MHTLSKIIMSLLEMTFGNFWVTAMPTSKRKLLSFKKVCSVMDCAVGEVIDGCQGLLSHSLSVVKASVRDVLGNAGMFLMWRD